MIKEEILAMFRSPGRRILVQHGDPVMEKFDERAETVVVTPDLAMEWIAFAWTKYGNGRNFYPTDLAKIRQYAEDMEDGRWKWSEDQPAIHLHDGLVADGRHRLHAILLSHKSVKCNVMRRESERE